MSIIYTLWILTHIYIFCNWICVMICIIQTLHVSLALNSALILFKCSALLLFFFFVSMFYLFLLNKKRLTCPIGDLEQMKVFLDNPRSARLNPPWGFQAKHIPRDELGHEVLSPQNLQQKEFTLITWFFHFGELHQL